MCLKTDIILLQLTLSYFQYLIITCLCMVEIYQQMSQSSSFNGNDLMVLFNWDCSRLINKLSLMRICLCQRPEYQNDQSLFNSCCFGETVMFIDVACRKCKCLKSRDSCNC